jgi:hypothetical protein
MWYSIVIKLPGQSMQEASTRADQIICAYDGAVYGDRNAKKMAKRDGADYIRHGPNVGQPRLVKAPVDPRAATAPEGAIYSRDRQRGFYWVGPENPAEMAVLGLPEHAYDRDVLGEKEAMRRAEGDLAEIRTMLASAGASSLRLTVHGSDFLASVYQPVEDADGVYVLDVEDEPAELN